MRWKDRLSRDDKLESFWCKLDSWQRYYTFGVNWRPHEYNQESWSEFDYLELLTTIRSKTSRPYRNLQLRLYPAEVEREKINPELKAIGNVWTERGRKSWLCCGAFVPADAFHSICSAVAANAFVEVQVEVRNLNRGSGSTSDFSLSGKLTDLSEDE
jgi:hypothetical protein